MLDVKLYTGSIQMHNVPAKWLGVKNSNETNKHCLLVSGANCIQF